MTRIFIVILEIILLITRRREKLTAFLDTRSQSLCSATKTHRTCYYHYVRRVSAKWKGGGEKKKKKKKVGGEGEEKTPSLQSQLRFQLPASVMKREKKTERRRRRSRRRKKRKKGRMEQENSQESFANMRERERESGGGKEQM